MDDFVKSEALRATLNNVHAIEMNSVRPLLTHSLDQIHRLGKYKIDIFWPFFVLIFPQFLSEMAMHNARMTRLTQSSQNTSSFNQSSSMNY